MPPNLSLFSLSV